MTDRWDEPPTLDPNSGNVEIGSPLWRLGQLTKNYMDGDEDLDYVFRLYELDLDHDDLDKLAEILKKREEERKKEEERNKGIVRRTVERVQNSGTEAAKELFEAERETWAFIKEKMSGDDELSKPPEERKGHWGYDALRQNRLPTRQQFEYACRELKFSSVPWLRKIEKAGDMVWSVILGIIFPRMSLRNFLKIRKEEREQMLKDAAPETIVRRYYAFHASKELDDWMRSNGYRIPNISPEDHLAMQELTDLEIGKRDNGDTSTQA